MTAPTPLRTYDEGLLDAISLTSRDFARTWVRMLLRDRPEVDRGSVPLGPGQPLRPREPTWPEFSRTDQELNAALALDALTLTVGNEVRVYYRPHITAARLYLGDPNLWKSRAVDGSSESRRDSTEIVGAWLAQGAGLDKLLPLELQPPPGLEVEITPAADEPYSPGIPLQIGGL
ncbi:hypothetical protein ACFP81_10650 [Deinococcus lacus]|uniref:Uncharacterized protein n=1 Tax=Deinococcus lacus TaxID=392561 RepID=A0ABW1YFV2_9DEIO